MNRIITGTIAFALTLVALGPNQQTSPLAADIARTPLSAEALGLGHAETAANMGGASGGVLYQIGEEIPQTV
jgi:hypothetical protein